MLDWARAPGAAVITALGLCLSLSRLHAAGVVADTQNQLRELRQQNQALQEQMLKQQALIEELARKVSSLPAASSQAPHPSSTDREARDIMRAPLSTAFGKVHLSGEGGVGLFHSGSRGRYPNTEFRVDEAKLFLEAPVWGEVYFFLELDAFLREDSDINLGVGEAYVDVQNLSRLWNQDNQLNVRIGRMDIPFGEEYLTRDAIDNPLVSHSIMDLWGVDEGVALYGTWKKWQYVVAVQNGGHDGVRDYNGDKAVIARLGVDPLPWLHVSASVMRTGDLDARNDYLSELWLGPGFVHSIGSTNTTRFHAELLQGDIHLNFQRTAFKAAGGVLRYDDDDSAGDNKRQVYYYSLEGTRQLVKGLYAAARWSQVFAADGFPIIGNGNPDDYFGRVLTEELALLSLGLGYRWSPQLVLKAEYSLEWGRELGGRGRTREDLFAIMAAFAF